MCKFLCESKLHAMRSHERSRFGLLDASAFLLASTAYNPLADSVENGSFDGSAFLQVYNAE